VQRFGADNDEWWATWDDINARSLGRHPMLDSRLARLLVKYFAGSTSFRGTLHGPEDVAAQAVLVPDGRGRWSIFCPQQASVGLLVFERSIEGNLDAMRSLFRALPGIPLALSLPYQDPEFGWLSSAKASLLGRLTLGTTVAIRSPNFDDYWTSRPKELRDNVRRRQRKVKEAGLESTLTVHTSAEAVAAGVDRYGLLESRGWKGKEGTALHPDNEQGRFYREALKAFAPTGDARVYELFLGDRLAASRLVLSGPTMHVVLKVTHDEELRQYVPGHLQLHEMLKSLLTVTEQRSVELYTKASRDWLLWATHQRDIETLTLYRHWLIERLASRRRARAAALASATQPAGAAPET